MYDSSISSIQQKEIVPFNRTVNNNFRAIGRFYTNLKNTIQADCPLIFLDTYDYEFVDRIVKSLVQEKELGIAGRNIREYIYGIESIQTVRFSAKGNYRESFTMPSFNPDNITNFFELLFASEDPFDLLLVKGFTEMAETHPYVVEWIRTSIGHQLNRTENDDTHSDLQQEKSGRKKRRVILVIGPAIPIPSLLLPYSAKLVLPKPDEEDIRNIWENWKTEKGKDPLKYESNPAIEKKLYSYLKGYTHSEVEYLLNRAILDRDFMKRIVDSKISLVKKTSLLNLIEETDDFEGLSRLKKHLEDMKKLLKHRDRFLTIGLPPPKGILLVGMPGCGKSLAAHAASKILDLPLLQLDLSRILDQHLGKSELNFRIALEIAEKSSPCILWIDELEKAFSGLEDETGVMKRILGSFLTWMQETKSAVYIIATANNIDTLPPEFKRKGRFDKIFSILMPTMEEREKIFRLKLEKIFPFPCLEQQKDTLCKELAQRTAYSRMQLPGTTTKDDDGVSGADIAAILYQAFCKSIILAENGGNEKEILLSNSLFQAIEDMKGKTQRHLLEGGTPQKYEEFKKKLQNSGYEPAS